MPRLFNSSEPNMSADYTLSGPGIRTLIEQKQCFTIHGPQKSGKTTLLRSLGQELTRAGRYAAVLLPLERGAPYFDIGIAELAILETWRDAVNTCLPPELQPPSWPETAPGNRLAAALRVWARQSPRPLVVFLDGVDALQDNVRTSMLCQLRAGFRTRPAHFPWSMALVSLRPIREYNRHPCAPPFDIAAESLSFCRALSSAR